MAENKTAETKRFWQRDWFKNVLWFIAILAIYFVARSFMQGEVAKGQAPAIDTQSITGQPIQLSDYKGRPVMVHFWATWCPVCEYERDGIEAVAKKYAVINIATQSGSNAELLAYARQHGMNADIIVNDANGELMKRFGAKATPTSFIVDANGDIQFVEVGYSTSMGLKARLWSLSE